MARSTGGESEVTSSPLREDIRTLAEQLYHAWSSNAPLVTLSRIRDEVLASRNRVDVQILTLSSVAKIACPEQSLADDSWASFFTLANACTGESDSGDEAGAGAGSDGPGPGSRRKRKRKRTDNVATRIRNLALLAALWSPQLIDYYGWSSAGNAQVNLMRLCALRWPRFVDDFCPRLNSILLHRHCEALKDSRVRGLNEAPLQPLRDFNITALETAAIDQARLEEWIHNSDGEIAVDDHGTLLNELRPNHFRIYLLQQDRYGMLVSRNVSSPPGSPYTEASPSPSFSHFAIDFARSEIDDAPILNAMNISPHPSLSDTTFASAENTSNASSRSTHTSRSDLDQWNTPPPTTMISGRGEDMGPGEDRMRQSYRQSLTPLTLNPAVLTLSRGEFSWEDAPPPEQHIFSEDSLGEQPMILGRKSKSMPDGNFIHPQKNISVLRAAIRSSPIVNSKKRTELTVGSPLVPHQGRLTIEEVLHNKYRSTIMAHVERISKKAESTDVSTQRKLRATWLTKITKWASISTPDSPKYSKGRDQFDDEADIIYLTSDQLITAASRNEVFDKPILIKEFFSDSGMHTVEGLASQLNDTSPNATIDIMSLDCEEHEQISVQEFISCAGCDQQTGYGVKANLRNVTKAHRPLFTMLSRFRLLQSLFDRAQGGILGKRTRPFLTSVSGCINFNVLGTAGAFSGPQLNSLSGTWLRNLDGVKLLMMMPELEMQEAEWKAFGKMGSSWAATTGSRLLVLEQDDVLLIPPGSKIVHAIYSLNDDVIEGGLFWDDLNVIGTLRAILWNGKHQIATNEGLAHLLPRIVDELGLLVKSQVDRFRGSLSKAEFLGIFDDIVSELKGLGCQCGLCGCLEKCSCRRLRRRCTSWCLAHENIAVLDCYRELWNIGNDEESDLNEEIDATCFAEKEICHGQGVDHGNDDHDEDEDMY